MGHHPSVTRSGADASCCRSYRTIVPNFNFKLSPVSELLRISRESKSALACPLYEMYLWTQLVVVVSDVEKSLQTKKKALVSPLIVW